MKVKLNDVRISFIDALWTAKEFKAGDGKPRYSATFLIEPGSANDKAIRAAINQEGTAQFGAKWPAIKKGFEGQTNKCAYQDGALKDYDGYQDRWYLAAHNKARPLVLNRTPWLVGEDGKPVMNAAGQKEPNLIKESDGILYAGCYVNATVDIYVQRGENPGIRASVTAVQFFRDGDSFGGGTRASADDFDDLGEGADAGDFTDDLA